MLTGPQIALFVTQEMRHPCEHYKGNRNLSGNSHEPCLQLRRPGWCCIASTMPANSGTWFQKLSSTEVCVCVIQPCTHAAWAGTTQLSEGCRTCLPLPVLSFLQATCSQRQPNLPAAFGGAGMADQPVVPTATDLVIESLLCSRPSRSCRTVTWAELAASA